MLLILLILQNNSSMDHSNQSSQQNIPRKRGRNKEVELNNIPIFPPHDIFLQFTPAGGKKAAICAIHRQCQALRDQNSIPENNIMNLHHTTCNHGTIVEIRCPVCKQCVTKTMFVNNLGRL